MKLLKFFTNGNFVNEIGFLNMGGNQKKKYFFDIVLQYVAKYVAKWFYMVGMFIFSLVRV